MKLKLSLGVSYAIRTGKGVGLFYSSWNPLVVAVAAAVVVVVVQQLCSFIEFG